MKMAELVKGIDYKGKGKMTGKEADDDDDGPFPKKALEWRENGKSRLEWDKRAKYVLYLNKEYFPLLMMSFFPLLGMDTWRCS